MKKKKILIIHESMTGGGAERVLVTILSAFDYDRYDVTLLLIYDEGPFFEHLSEKAAVRVLYRGRRTFARRVERYNRRVRDFMERWRARRALGSDRFDVTISFMEGTALRLHGDLMDYAPRNLSWVHTDISGFRWYDKWLTLTNEKKIYRKIDEIAFVSADAIKGFKKIIGDYVPSRVIYNPVHRNMIRNAAEEKVEDVYAENDAIKLVTVGRLIEVKNQRLLIEACRILENRGIDFRLTIVGIGPLRDDLESLAKKHGLGDKIMFAGFCTNPFRIMASADVFCLSSKAEGYPMVIAEALCLGVPVLSTDITGPREMLASGGGRILPHSAEAFADAIGELAGNREKLEALKAETVQASRQFDIDATMDIIERFIDNGQ